MLKHNYVCIKLVQVLCIPFPHLTKESAKAEILPSVICPSELYFLASTMTPHPPCQDRGRMNKRDFFEVHSKNKPHDNTDYFFTAQIIRQEKSQTNGLNGTSPSLWAEGKYKNKLCLPCLPWCLNANVTYVSSLTTILYDLCQFFSLMPMTTTSIIIRKRKKIMSFGV